MIYRLIKSGALLGCLLACLLACSVSFGASEQTIGKVIASIGSVQAVSASGQGRVLQRGAVVHVRETIETGNRAYVQIRFQDNTLLSLKPETTFRLDRYQLKKSQPKQDRYGATIVKGGFKMITGVIAKQNPKQFKIRSYVANIHVRGTGFMGHYDPVQKELSTGVFKGGIALAQCKGGAAPSFEGFCVCPSGSKQKNKNRCVPEMIALTSVGGKTAYGRATIMGLMTLSSPPAKLGAPGGQSSVDWQENLSEPPSESGGGDPMGANNPENTVNIVEQEESFPSEEEEEEFPP